jgi:hypothetical protein
MFGCGDAIFVWHEVKVMRDGRIRELEVPIIEVFRIDHDHPS